MSQAPDVVLVRQPGNRTYDAPAPVASMATSEWEYAVLSENVYVQCLVRGGQGKYRVRADDHGWPRARYRSMAGRRASLLLNERLASSDRGYT